MNTWWRNFIEPGLANSSTNISKKRWMGMRGKKVELTKVTRPRLQPVYQRTELYTLLDELSATPVIMVNAKSGAGKTTLLANYAESRDIPCLWYRVDRDDEDINKFFSYLEIAVLRANPYNNITLPQVSPERIMRVTSVANEYFRNLYQCLDNPFMFVFDNYEQLSNDALLHDVIGEACTALPTGGRIALINNSDAGANVPKLPSPRPMATLEDEDLMLSPAEVKAIAASHGVSLSSDQVAEQLHMKVGGWTAGLVHELKGEWIPQ